MPLQVQAVEEAGLVPANARVSRRVDGAVRPHGLRILLGMAPRRWLRSAAGVAHTVRHSAAAEPAVADPVLQAEEAETGHG